MTITTGSLTIFGSKQKQKKQTIWDVQIGQKQKPYPFPSNLSQIGQVGPFDWY